MPICGSCIPERVKYPGKPLVALPDRVSKKLIYIYIYISFLDTFKPRSYPTTVDEGTTIAIIGGMMNVVFKSCPLDTLGNRF